MLEGCDDVFYKGLYMISSVVILGGQTHEPTREEPGSKELPHFFIRSRFWFLQGLLLAAERKEGLQLLLKPSPHQGPCVAAKSTSWWRADSSSEVTACDIALLQWLRGHPVATECQELPGAGVKVLVAQSCPPLCDSMDYSPPGSSVHGILSRQKILEWVSHSLLQGIFTI